MGWLIGSALAVLLLMGQVRLPAEGVDPYRFLLSWGKRGDKPGEFYSPIGIAINRKDEVFVTDLNNARLQKFSAEGEYLGGFDLKWDAPDRKSTQAGGIAVDEKNRIYLSFMVQDKIAVYTETGTLVREWGRRGTGDGEFHQPGGIVLGPGGTLFVADQGNHRIQKFTTDGKFLGKWGEHGDRPGQFGGPEPAGSRFAGPHFLALDKKFRLYTTEGALGRIQQFSAMGAPLHAWGDKGQQPGGFGEMRLGGMKNSVGPIAIAADRRGRIWVSSLNDRVQAFTPEGKFLFGIGGSGSEPGKFSGPHGMAFDSKGYLYVCDARNQRIQKFEILAR